MALNNSGRLPLNIRGVMFDLDETLVNSLESFWRVFNHGAINAGLPETPKDRVAVGLSHGWTLAQIIQGIYPQMSGAAAEAMIADMYESMSRVMNEYPITIKPEAPEVLETIARAGIRIGMVTARNSTVEKVQEELAAFAIDHYFDCIITGREYVRKPSPEGIHACLECMNLKPEEAVMVGDAEADILAGQEAGVSVILLADGTHYTAKLPTAAHCCAIISKLSELPAKLNLTAGN